MKSRDEENQQISALADGELDVSHHDAVLTLLREPEALDIWGSYHLIGDVLRSEEASPIFSADFATRLAARLAEERIHLKSEECTVKPAASLAATADRSTGLARRLVLPGAAIAATVLLAFSGSLSGSFEQATLGSLAGDRSTATSAVMQASMASTIRDPQIDNYLLAHQRLTPSLYTSTHYARFSNSANE